VRESEKVLAQGRSLQTANLARSTGNGPYYSAWARLRDAVSWSLEAREWWALS
jgi:hypothetical protein